MIVVNEGGQEVDEEEAEDVLEANDGAFYGSPLDEASPLEEESPLDEAEALPRVRSHGRPRTSRFKSPVEIPPSRRKMKVTATHNDGTSIATRASKQKCRICGSHDHQASKCPDNNVADKPVKPRKCHACGEEGHYHNTCGRKSSYLSLNK